MSKRYQNKDCKRKTKNKAEVNIFNGPQKERFYRIDVDNFGRTLLKASTFLDRSTSLPLLRSSPSLSPLPLLSIPLFFLSLAPTTLYNVRNTLGCKSLAGLF
jgi:hypothetical protein